MVTLIVVPIICLYFYFVTKKEIQTQESKWLETGQIPLESILTGEIRHLTETKQRFYYNRYIYVQEMKLQTEIKVVTIKKITPLTKEAKIEPLRVGEIIRACGSWKDNQFYFNHLEHLSKGYEKR